MNFSRMKTLTNVLTRVDKIYNDTMLVDGFELNIDPTIMSTAITVRHGEVLSVPQNNIKGLLKGDKIFFHPNQIKSTILRGGEVCSFNCFVQEENIFVIDVNEIYAYERDGVFHAADEHCFVKPFFGVRYDDMDVPQFLKTYEAKYFGVLEHGNKYLSSNGIHKGDIVAFDDYSKHRFVIDGVLVFRMDNDSILAKYEGN